MQLMGSMIKHALLVSISGLFFSGLQAQKPAHYERRDADLLNAMELFDKGHYGAAQYEFEQVADAIDDKHAIVRMEAEYFGALCAVKLFHDDAGSRMTDFVMLHPESPRAGEVRKELFLYQFEQKDWEEALAFSERVDESLLSEKEREEFHFKRGYAYFKEEMRGKAMNDFDIVQSMEGDYKVPATYYASHIHYERQNYESALQGFRTLESDQGFGPLVPYYIAEILYIQGKYDELAEYADPLLDNSKGARKKAKIHRLVGESLYRRGKYAEALPHLEEAIQRVGVAREDRYVLGHTYFKVGDCEKAGPQLTQVTNTPDSLGQLAAHHMASCYLQGGQKQYARNAFKEVYRIGADPTVTEDALFNYAKLSYELSYDPYHEAIAALEDYLKKYPNTPRRDEAFGFLMNVYLKTGNYEAALNALEKIQDKDITLKEAYQKTAFNRGIELYEGRKYEDAIIFLQKALKFPQDPRVNAECHYWKGESNYRLKEYQGALLNYDDLRNSPGAFASDLYEQASYSMGYCYFKQKDYDNAMTAFRRYLNAGEGEALQQSDAMLRTADCYYVRKELDDAINWYNKAIRLGTKQRAYAQFQRAVCMGLKNELNGKISTLENLLDVTPNSRYAGDARFQLGETYLMMENDAQAMKYFQELLDKHPNSPHVRTAMLRKGLIHKRQGDDQKALETFKNIVATYPTMEGSRDALVGIEGIYVEMGKVDEYEAYLNSLSFVDPNTIDLDEKYYRSAEQLYFADDCAAAENAFADYLDKYPNGAYALSAHFYKGDCAYRSDRFDEALPHLETVVASPGNQFMESALFGLSTILYKREAWEGALERYDQLEQVASFPQNLLASKLGQMRCAEELGRVDEAADAAQKVLDDATATDDMKAEAGVRIGNAQFRKGEMDDAFSTYTNVVKRSNNEHGAEAKFQMALIRYEQERYSDAEAQIFALVKKYPSYDEWKARGFILLGDVYVGLNDLFQAKVTLQSVVDNVDDPELVAQAQSRLDAIAATEQGNTEGQ
jgi:TolA-binding protein